MRRLGRLVAFLTGLVAAALCSRPAAAEFPGRNGHIAYRSGNNAIFLSDVGVLASTPFTYSFEPKFSPDGLRVVYRQQTVNADGYFYDIRVVNTDGTFDHSVASSGSFPGVTYFGSITSVAWTPDGQISFSVNYGTLL